VKRAAPALLAFSLAACVPPAKVQVPPAAPPPAARPEAAPAVRPEFRGVWVATVANIDWPSARGLPSGAQRAEMVAILERAAALNLNAVVLQVRPAADAIFPSVFEPWSEFLSGESGRAPDPPWDPLAAWVAEAHRRGLQLHAWFNPFRARHSSAKSPIPPGHIARRRPDLAREYGSQLWLDPGEEEVQAHALAVILDVVARYDVDGVHLDDYFYPYPVRDASGVEVDFPDGASFGRYVASGGALSRDDWRRWNVNRFIQRLYGDVHRVRPSVLVGVSPFGIWRPDRPQGVKGFNAYEKLFADARTWLERGWVDYLSPQLYWGSWQTEQSFSALLAWWAAQNPQGRHVWPGLIASRVGSPENGWPPSEIVEQIRASRGQSGVTGHVLFSMKALKNGQGGLGDLLRRDVYAERAPVPPSPWLAAPAPAR